MAVDLRPQLVEAVDNALNYPKNLICSNALGHSMDALRHQLDERSQKLFCPEPESIEKSKTRVDVWELYGENDGFNPSRPRNASELEAVLRTPIDASRRDPRQRIICIHAPHSKAKLGISRKMFLQTLSYHNVMPEFLQYVFPFGLQHYQRDFHLMGFRSESRLGDPAINMAIPQLGRHGRHIELCYSLKSVEMDDRAPPLGWSVRQCSLHHFYDLKSQQSNWIVVKANYVISDAVVKQARDDQSARAGSTDRKPSILASTLDIHNILSAWAGQNWSWYINKLEAYLQDASRWALSASWELPTQPIAEIDIEEKEIKPITSEKKSWTFKSLHKRDLSGDTLQGDKFHPFRAPTRSNTIDTVKSESGLRAHHTTGFDDFSFRDLQSVQFVEERANEVLLILRSNSNVLKDLLNHYRTLLKSPSCSEDLPMDFAAAYSQLEQRVTSIDKDIQLQIARVQTLLSFTADRKSLLNAVFQYRSMQASRLYAAKAQVSAERMEDMTAQMGIIAKKTEAETVAMRIITIVTLFFLPGTFMAALFSTPIVNFDNHIPEGNGFSWSNVGVGALKLYVIASLPLVVLTFATWGLMSSWKTRQDVQKRRKEAEAKQNMA